MSDEKTPAATITLPAKLARELAEDGGKVDGWTVVRNEQTGSRRWVSEHELVIERDGLFYIGYYDQGLTENQDERAWEWDETATFYRVEKRVEMVETVSYVTPAGQDERGGEK